MKLSDISGTSLQYGDKVKVRDANSKYAGLEGKIVNISASSATVKFEGIKKAITVMVEALEKI